MPAGWVFDTVLERLAAVVDPHDPALAARLRAARTEADGGYLDLRDLECERWALLAQAAEHVSTHLIQDEGPGGMAPAFATGLRTQMHQLCVMVQAGRQACEAKQPRPTIQHA
jgi:hypothetical protein